MNKFLILDKLPVEYRNYKIKKIQGEASKRIFYRLNNDKQSIICMDSSNDNNEYENYLKIHSYLKNLDISIPVIYERISSCSVLLMEDFGELRFDKILKRYKLNNLLDSAVKTLINLRNNIDYDNSYDLIKYDFNIFKSEISEFFQYYEYKNGNSIPSELELEFYEIWEQYFNSLAFDFNTLVHKDFNINNLIYLPLRKGHLKCGVIDFQSAFWGESSWDLFSLLEDSRLNFTDEYNDYFINYYYKKTNQQFSFKDFVVKYYMLNCSRQTRLLGRWVNLAKSLNENFYLDFITTTKQRLLKGIQVMDNNRIKLIYKKIMPDLFI